MKAETEYLLEKFPVRKRSAQKAAFRVWLTETLTAAGYEARTESGCLLVQNHNVVVGDPERAAVVFTAHYDTPARLPWPNMILPQNFLLTIVAQLPLVLLIAFSVLVAELIALFLMDDPFFGLIITYAMLLLVLFLLYAGPANPSNVNDNTSGVATLLEIALSLPAEQRSSVAFVFFDNEEKGLLGSAQFKKAHGKRMANTLVVNFDCVSDGDHILFFPTKKLKKRPELLELLGSSFRSGDNKTTAVVRGFGYYPSDQKHFPLGVGVAALRKNRFGYWLGRIHTHRDTVFQRENIDLLRQGALALAAATAAAHITTE